MKFTLKTPCKECPFRRTMGYLSPERAREIAENAATGNFSFSCHKTLSGQRVPPENHLGETVTYRPGEQDLWCAGALILGEKAGRRNRMQQIAERLGLLKPDELDMEADVYDTVEEMVKGHGR